MSNSNHTQVDIGATVIPLHKAIKLAINAFKIGNNDVGIPYIKGLPGGGKSMLIRKFVEELGWGYLSYEPALQRAEAFGGIPDLIWVAREDSYIEETEIPVMSNGVEKSEKKKLLQRKKHYLTTKWSEPEIITDIKREAPKYKILVVLLDDWHLCDEEIQKIGFELFTYRSLNGNKVPDNVRFILAGNTSSAAGAKIQLSAIVNRCYVFSVVSDVEYWLKNYAEPNQLLSVGLSYFYNKDNQLYFHESESSAQFGSPRSWTYLFKLLAAYYDSDEYKSEMVKASGNSRSTTPTITKDIMAICHSCVGPKAASDFFNYMSIFSKVDVKKLFVNGEVDIPNNRIDQFAYMSAMTSEYYNLESTPRLTKFQKTKLVKERGMFIKMIIDFADNARNMELLVCTIRQLATKPGNKELGLLNGGTILMSLIQDSRMPTGITTKLKELTRKLTVRVS